MRRIRQLTQTPQFRAQNQSVPVTNTSDEGRDAFLRRFALNSFGSKISARMAPYCGLAYRAAPGIMAISG